MKTPMFIVATANNIHLLPPELLRQWLMEGRAQSASFQDVKAAKDEFVSIELEPKSAL